MTFQIFLNINFNQKIIFKKNERYSNFMFSLSNQIPNMILSPPMQIKTWWVTNGCFVLNITLMGALIVRKHVL